MSIDPQSSANRYDSLLARAKELHAAGRSEDDVLTAVRSGGGWAMESINVLRALYGLSLHEAKVRLHASPVWADQASRWEHLHEDLERLANDR